jgi:hypothetical protein
MTADDLLELLHERPFKPLRPHLADDQVREISRPNMALVAKDTVLIGTPSRHDSRLAARMFSCPISIIAKAERIERGDDPNHLADTLAWL